VTGLGLKRTTAFLLVLGAAVLGLVTLAAWYVGFYQPAGGSVGGMMGQMMGGSGGLALTMPWQVWVGLLVLAAVAVAGLIGLGYFIAYPEIRTAPQATPPAAAAAPKEGPPMSWAVLMRTSKPEEKRVLEVLAAHQGNYLQKFVVKEAGLSKLKTHRVVSRLAERGVVNVERSGNTNQVTLAPWVMMDAKSDLGS